MVCFEYPLEIGKYRSREITEPWSTVVLAGPHHGPLDSYRYVCGPRHKQVIHSMPGGPVFRSKTDVRCGERANTTINAPGATANVAHDRGKHIDPVPKFSLVPDSPRCCRSSERSSMRRDAPRCGDAVSHTKKISPVFPLISFFFNLIPLFSRFHRARAYAIAFRSSALGLLLSKI